MAKNRKYDSVTALVGAGISYDDAVALRRISMTLHRWHELECGDSNAHASWGIERDEETNKPYLVTHFNSPTMGTKPRRTPIADREAGALKRLDTIMRAYPKFAYYAQTDPRGCSLYILTEHQLATYGRELESIYSQGIPVCR